MHESDCLCLWVCLGVRLRQLKEKATIQRLSAGKSVQDSGEKKKGRRNGGRRGRKKEAERKVARRKGYRQKIQLEKKGEKWGRANMPEGPDTKQTSRHQGTQEPICKLYTHIYYDIPKQKDNYTLG